ncbi:hypothetical protein, partial [Planomonospora algeriensis]
MSERRVLVEGWSYTAKDNEHLMKHGRFSPFWDAGRLAANDGFFRDPSAESAERLRTEYGVRWLFVDTRFGRPSVPLRTVAELRFRRGVCEVYELVA